MVAEEPVTDVETRIVSCDGGGGALGHPKVYINLVSISLMGNRIPVDILLSPMTVLSLGESRQTCQFQFGQIIWSLVVTHFQITKTIGTSHNCLCGLGLPFYISQSMV